MQRSFVHLLSGGRDGHSPHVVADVLTVLRTRFSHVALVKITPQNALHLVVDGVFVVVTSAPEEENQDGLQFYYASLNHSAVRFQAMRSVDVPVLFADDTDTPITNDVLFQGKTWHKDWSNPNETIQEYVSRLAKKPIRIIAFSNMLYLQETAFLNAIECLLAYGN